MSAILRAISRFDLAKSFEGRYSRLSFLLEKSAIYTSMLKTQMEQSRMKLASGKAPSPAARQATRPGPKSSRVRKRRRIQDSDGEDGSSKRNKLDDGQVQTPDHDIDHDMGGPPKFQQPALITGAKLKDYQLQGVEWMISLDQNGISGILGQSF